MEWVDRGNTNFSRPMLLNGRNGPRKRNEPPVELGAHARDRRASAVTLRTFRGHHIDGVFVPLGVNYHLEGATIRRTKSKVAVVHPAGIKFPTHIVHRAVWKRRPCRREFLPVHRPSTKRPAEGICRVFSMRLKKLLYATLRRPEAQLQLLVRTKCRARVLLGFNLTRRKLEIESFENVLKTVILHQPTASQSDGED